MTQATAQEISTQAQSTEVILTLFVGETYVEAGFFDQTYINEQQSSQPGKKSKQTPTALYNQLFYLPHQSLKSIFTQLKKILTEKNFALKETYFVSRYLERLQNFRLGGSVAQLIPQGFENSIHFGNSLSLSLANPSLIISKASNETTTDDLQKDIEQIKKINPDCDKIVVYDFKNPEAQDLLTKYNFQVFNCSLNQKTPAIRRIMFNAGVSGTQKELFAELTELTASSEVNVWLKGQWKKLADLNSCSENQAQCAVDLYMSGVDFLFHHSQKGTQYGNTQFHFDFDNWECLKNKPCTSWISPWGEIEFSAAYSKETLPIGPRQEILIDETGRLQISKGSTSIESGPFIAGRSVKSVMIDLFSDEILSQPSLYKMIGSPDLTLLNTKIKSQFKALENGQKNDFQISTAELKNLVHTSVKTRIAFDTIDMQSDCPLTGNLGFLFNAKSLAPDEGYFWSAAMMKNLMAVRS